MEKVSIKCLLNDINVNILKQLENKEVDMYMNVLSNETVTFCFDFYETKYFIENTPTLQIDGDEYPIMEIYNINKNEYKNNCNHTINFFKKNVEIEHIYLIRDSVSFFRDSIKFRVINDVGIKFITNAMDVLMIMQDSCGGLMSIYTGSNLDLFDTEEGLKNQWIFKADEFESLKREEVKIF